MKRPIFTGSLVLLAAVGVAEGGGLNSAHAWEKPAERMIEDFLYAQPGISEFEISSVSCRTVACEVHLLAWRSNAMPDSAASTTDALKSIMMRYSRTEFAQALVLSGLTTLDLDEQTHYTLRFERVVPPE